MMPQHVLASMLQQQKQKQAAASLLGKAAHQPKPVAPGPIGNALAQHMPAKPTPQPAPQISLHDQFKSALADITQSKMLNSQAAQEAQERQAQLQSQPMPEAPKYTTPEEPKDNPMNILATGLAALLSPKNASSILSGFSLGQDQDRKKYEDKVSQSKDEYTAKQNSYEREVQERQRQEQLAETQAEKSNSAYGKDIDRELKATQDAAQDQLRQDGIDERKQVAAQQLAAKMKIAYANIGVRQQAIRNSQANFFTTLGFKQENMKERYAMHVDSESQAMARLGLSSDNAIKLANVHVAAQALVESNRQSDRQTNIKTNSEISYVKSALGNMDKLIQSEIAKGTINPQQATMMLANYVKSGQFRHLRDIMEKHQLGDPAAEVEAEALAMNIPLAMLPANETDVKGNALVDPATGKPYSTAPLTLQQLGMPAIDQVPPVNDDPSSDLSKGAADLIGSHHAESNKPSAHPADGHGSEADYKDMLQMVGQKQKSGKPFTHQDIDNAFRKVYHAEPPSSDTKKKMTK